VLTLAAPGFDLSGPYARAIALPSPGSAPTPTTNLRLTGWGTTLRRAACTSSPCPDNTDPQPRYLQIATIRTATGCTAYAGYDAAVQLCAGQPGRDACQ